MIKALFNNWKERFKTFFAETLWEIDETVVRGYRRFFLYIIRVATITFRGYHDNMIPVRATALAYTTLISIVPFLAVTFSLFKAFGGLNKAMDPIKHFVLSNLAAGTGDTAVTYLDQFIENFQAGAVGLIGFLLLILSTISVLTTIEQVLNNIWGVPKSRTFIRRFTSYWTIITIGPLLLGISLSVTGALQNNKLINDILALSGAQKFLISKIPWLTTYCLFTALYLIMPNTKVRFRSAVLGGVIGGSLWEIAKYGYTLYATQVVSNYKVYGSLGMIPIFLVWIYYTWLVVLIAAQIAYADQNVHSFGREKKSARKD